MTGFAVVLDDVRRFLRRYVVLTEPQTVAVTLWAAHTHCIDSFEVTPFLAITSPEKRCGKTRLLDALELVVDKPWRTVLPSEAVLFRKIAQVRPTLMLDETDAIFSAKNGNTEPLRALLNAGNRRGTSVPRCVGPTQRLEDFAIFCPKAFAGIGQLPDTVTDRSLVIRMARKRPEESAERFRFREADEAAKAIRERLAEMAAEATVRLEQARPAIPDALDDRAEEAWEPLLAIADLAGGDWPAQARRAALVISGSREGDDQAHGVRLLADICDVFAERGDDRLSSASLASELCEIETSPWGDLWGKRLDARGLARRLKPFDVHPRTVRFHDGSTAKGYHLDQFEDAFSRYLAGSERHNGTTRTVEPKTADSEPSQDPLEDWLDPASANGCDGVTDPEALPELEWLAAMSPEEQDALAREELKRAEEFA